MSRRIATMFWRYAILHWRSAPRIFEMFFWPVMELLVWGFVARHMSGLLKSSGDGALAVKAAGTLLTGVIFWDILYRSQQGVSLMLMEELWTKNIVNLFISPLTTWEWVSAAYLYGLAKTLLLSATLALLALAFYRFSIVGALGLTLIPFVANLLIMGWAFGIFTAGLLIRWGHAAEALIWGVPFLIQPFSAIFYPLSVYPAPLKPLCLLFPSTHVMEGMRASLSGGFSTSHFLWALGLNLAYLAAFGWFFVRTLEASRESGALVRIAS